MDYASLLKHAPYSVADYDKSALFHEAIKTALAHHIAACPPYGRLCDKKGLNLNDFTLADIPYIPVSLFKTLKLASNQDDAIVRVLRSSASTSQTPSQIYLDNETRTRQMKTLVWLMKDCLGPKRHPFVIMDVNPNPGQTSDKTLSARAAAIRGFLHAASEVTYCMTESDNQLTIDFELLEDTLARHARSGERVVLFGYTYVLYHYMAKQLKEKSRTFSLPQAMLLHIGGWKKLQAQAVSPDIFNATLSAQLGIDTNNIIDIYGFTEQLGLIYPNRGLSHKRCPLTAEIIIRDPYTLKPAPDGEVGLIELISPLPHSYPGVAVLLDDIGRIVSRAPSDDGRHGTAFEVLGRAKQAETRGCGDIMGEQVSL